MPQMAIAVSAASRMTSNSISYQPSRLRSTSTWPMGLAASPRAIALARLRLVHREAAASAAEGEGRPHHHRRVEVAHEGQPVLDRLHHGALRHRLPDAGHQDAEAAAILRRPHRGQRRAQHRAPRIAPARRRRPAPRPGSARSARPGSAAARPAGARRSPAPGRSTDKRPDNHRSAHVGIGHDRGRVGVDQDRLHALAAQRQAGLHAGVVELGRLADDDRPGADDQDASRGRSCRPVGPVRRRSAPGRRCAAASIGPGAPSGWNWTDAIRPEAWTSPSTVPSLRSRWLTR